MIMINRRIKKLTHTMQLNEEYWKENEIYCNELKTKPIPEIGKVLVTGATGYIGGRLVPNLKSRGYKVRVMVRGDASQLKQRWPGVEIVIGDALDLESLIKALKGIHTAFYLIHSMRYGPNEFEKLDILAAANFRCAAEKNKLKRIVYLGGLGDNNSQLSAHLRSRQEVHNELKKGKTEVTILRAAIIIGSGSASFEMIEHLVKNFKILFLPYWTKTKCQPIGIRNVIMYLVGVLESPETAGHTYDIGGRNILNYHEMLFQCAKVFGLNRIFLPLFFSNIRALSYLASLYTPVPHAIIKCLLESTANTVICQDNSIKDIISMRLLSYQEAIFLAATREDHDRISTRWSDAYPPAHELAIKLTEVKNKKLFTKSASTISKKKPSCIFASICRIGGKKGWFHTNWLWKLRGIIDKILMGVGTSRGRRDASRLRVNDVVDFWRVEDLQPDKRLLLRAEMKLPGRAWLEFSIDSEHNKQCTLTVQAYYQSYGIWGTIYWYGCLPFHNIIFKDLIMQIEKRS